MEVPCQTDSEYSVISSNQCSWCAAEFITNKKQLKSLLLLKKKEEFLNLYNTCLLEGSNKRKEFNHRRYGENIDNKLLLEQYKLSIISYLTILENEDEEFIKILPPDLKEEFYTKIYNKIKSNYFEDHISDGASYLASRHGQSFAIISIPAFSKYIVLDSHIHNTKLLSGADLSKYLFNENCGHTHVTLIKLA